MGRSLMRACYLLIGGLVVCALGWTQPALAGVEAKINLSSQTMRVIVNGRHRHTWRVSTGRRGYRTPTGRYRPYLLRRRHFSSKYYNAPMPYSIFFRGGYAIHGTTHTRKLGRPASHGCIRLQTSNAARLFSLVQRHGKGRSRVTITGSVRPARRSSRPRKVRRRVASGGRCARTRRQCRARWRNNRSNYIGCLRYDRC